MFASAKSRQPTAVVAFVTSALTGHTLAHGCSIFSRETDGATPGKGKQTGIRITLRWLGREGWAFAFALREGARILLQLDRGDGQAVASRLSTLEWNFGVVFASTKM